MRVLLLLLALVPAIAAPATPAEQIRAAVGAAAVDGSFEGVVSAELFGGERITAGAGRPVRSDSGAWAAATPARIGSLTKSFTALVVLTLAADGVLDLQAPISTWVPDAPAPGRDLTLHQLMTHTAGIASDCGRGDFEALNRSTLLEECLALPLVGAADGTPAYSNLGFSVAAAVAEVASGETLETLLAERVLGPEAPKVLGYDLAPELRARSAVGYLDEVAQPRLEDRTAALGADKWALKGNGGMFGSAEAMLWWSDLLRGNGHLAPGLLEAALLPRVQQAPGLAVAYGWFLRFGPDGRVRQVSHAGSDGTFFSYLWFDPATDSGFYLIGNTGEEAGREMTRTVLGIMREAVGSNRPLPRDPEPS